MTTLRLVDTSTPAAKVDHLAEAEARRVEMCVEWDGKIRALKDQAADLVREAREKRAAAQKLDAPIPHGGGGNHEGAQELYRQVEALAERARRIEGVEIPALVREREAICMGTHPEISLIQRRAVDATEASRVAELHALLASYNSAEQALNRHMLKLATPETFELAAALDAADKAVRSGTGGFRQLPSFARLLLTAGKAVASS